MIVQLSWWKPYGCVDWPRGNRRGKFLPCLDREVLHVRRNAVCRRGLAWLSAQFGLELGQHLRRKSTSTLPDGNHVLQLGLLLGRNAFHDVVKQCWHELRHAFDSSGICAGFSSSFQIQILSRCLCLLDPLPHNAVDHVECTELVRRRRLLKCAIERLHYCRLCL